MKIFIFLFFSINLFAYSINFPFPQSADYSYGTRYKGNDSASVQNNFNKWLSSYYSESGDYARIKFDAPEYTVSEGIGYGMLIMVYMDNKTNMTKSKFDKLWNYYNKWPNSNGLMNWKINGFSNVDQQNAATDAELDVALALLMANKQWGDDKYLTDAKSLISKIWNCEVNSNQFLKPGDSWDNAKNPSYFSVAAMKLFAKVDNHDWDAVISNSYKCLKTVQNSSTGLVPDWCSEQGSPMSPGFDSHYADFHYDAVRTPWRIAMAYAWFGDSDAKAINDKIANWVTSNVSSPGNVKSGYYLNGNSYADYSDATFVGALSCAGMVDGEYQNWVDKGFLSTSSASATSYYNATLKVLYLLLLSGNFPNMYGSESGVSQTTDSIPSDETILSISNEVSFSLNSTNQDILEPNYSNLLSNGDFSNGMTGWSFGDYSNVSTTNIENEVFHASLSQGFSSSWQVQLMYDGVNLPKNNYTLLFDAYADKDRPIVVSAGMGSVIADTRIDVTAVKKTYSIPFSTDYDMSNQRFDFNLGLSDGNVYIDNVIVTSDANSGSGSESPYTYIKDGDDLWVVYEEKKVELFKANSYKINFNYKNFSSNTAQLEIYLVDVDQDNNVTSLEKLLDVDGEVNSMKSFNELLSPENDGNGYLAFKVVGASETELASLSGVEILQTTASMVDKLSPYNVDGYSVVVAPNPVANSCKLIIKGKKVDNIKLYNSNGNVLYFGNNASDIISKLSKGLYYIELYSGEKGVALNKFIKL